MAVTALANVTASQPIRRRAAGAGWTKAIISVVDFNLRSTSLEHDDIQIMSGVDAFAVDADLMFVIEVTIGSSESTL
jgi:hypothetical protein